MCLWLGQSRAQAQGWEGWTTVSRTCSRCGAAVPWSVEVGDKCPKCRALFVDEITRYQCLACGKRLPKSFKPGNPCPHCGAGGWMAVPGGGTCGCPGWDFVPPGVWMPRNYVPPAPATVDVGNRKVITTDAIEIFDSLIVPVAKVFEAMGCQVTAKDNLITVTRDDRSVSFTPSAYEFTVKAGTAAAQAGTFPVPSMEIYGVVYAPLRAIAEALGWKVAMQADKTTVFVGEDFALRIPRPTISGWGPWMCCGVRRPTWVWDQNTPDWQLPTIAPDYPCDWGPPCGCRCRWWGRPHECPRPSMPAWKAR